MSKKIIASLAAAIVLSMGSVGIASAHVTVKPAEVLSASFQTFTVSAPNEKAEPFNTVKLQIPAGLKHVSVTNKPGWQVTIDKVGEGEEATVSAITWYGNKVGSGFRDEFSFSAQVPADSGQLEWKAYQTYDSGVVVAWDRSQEAAHSDNKDEEAENSGPFSVTKVVSQSTADSNLATVQSDSDSAQRTADRALYIGVAGLILGVVGIALATRNQTVIKKK